MQTGYPRGNFIVFRMVYVMVFFYAFVLVFYVRSTKFLFHIFVYRKQYVQRDSIHV